MVADDANRLNLRAYLALAGATLDWRSDVARLLRSDVPLSRIMRDSLAAAIENITHEGPSLELTGHKAARDRFAGIASRHEWMAIARWVAEFKEQNLAGPNAVDAAATHFKLSVKKVESAVTYFNKTTVWVDQAMKSEAGQVMGRDWVERLHHSITVNPEMKRRNGDLVCLLGLSH